jgi:hypothetical protein
LTSAISFEKKEHFHGAQQPLSMTKQQLGLRRKSDVGALSGGMVAKLVRIGNFITHTEKFNQQMIGLIFGKLRSSSRQETTRGFILAIAWFVRVKHKYFEQCILQSNVRYQHSDLTHEQSAHLDFKQVSVFKSEQMQPERAFRFSVFPTDKSQLLGKSHTQRQFLVNEKKYDQMVYNICKVRKGIEAAAVEPVLQYSKTNIIKPSFVSKRTGISKNRIDEEEMDFFKPRSVSSEMVDAEEALEDKMSVSQEKSPPRNTASLQQTVITRLQKLDSIEFETDTPQRNSPKFTILPARPAAGKNSCLNRSSSRLPTVIATMEEKSRRKSRALFDLPDITRGLQLKTLHSPPKATISSVKKEFSTQPSLGLQETPIKLEKEKELCQQSAPKLRDFLLSKVISSHKWIAPHNAFKKIRGTNSQSDKQISTRRSCNPYTMKTKISDNISSKQSIKRSILSTKDFIINIK